MSSFLDSASKSSGNGDDLKAAYEILRQKWPILAGLLCGTSGTGENPSRSPPFSLTLWMEGRYLKFSARSDEHPQKAYGAVLVDQRGFDSLEEGLETGQFSWRPNTDRKRS
jgi:hypothetical protein